MSRNKLIKFEEIADQLASALVVLDQPIVGLLTSLFQANYYIRDEGMVREADDFLSRMSYLSDLVESHGIASSETIAYDANYFLNWRNLFQYLHFCELMPQVRRGYFDISGDEAEGFHLVHKETDISIYEINDVIFADLARPFVRENTLPFRLEIDEMVGAGTFDISVELLQRLKVHYEEVSIDFFDVPDSVYDKIARANSHDFESLRNFMFALAEAHQAILLAIKRTSFPAENLELQDQLVKQQMFVEFPQHSLVDIINSNTGIEKEKISGLLEFYTLDLRSGSSSKSTKNVHCGDGYLPPIVKTENAYYFSPIAVKTFMSKRNFFYALLKKDENLFNDVVSANFEPQLIEKMNNDLLMLDGIEVRCNKCWEASSRNGEIDVLAYSLQLNKAIVFQVKAVIPPQGARMVRNVEERILEGVDQILSFRQLPTVDRDRIISEALGFEVVNVTTIDVILSSSCLGSVKAWSRIIGEKICGANYPLLFLLIRESLDANEPDYLFDIQSWIKDKLDRIITESNMQWEEKEFQLFGTNIVFPSWSIDERPLRKIRNQILEAKAS